MTSALVVGASGLVGSALLRALGGAGVGTYRTRSAAGLTHLDARDQDAVARLLREHRGSVLFFPAAEPNVEWCEEHPGEARERNVTPALSALEAATSCGAHFVFFSSDYVFDGAAGPYDESASTRPISVYGAIKREIEGHVIAAGGTTIRTTTVFGVEPPPARNFALKLVARLREREPVKVPSDQLSTPTWADDLARATVTVAREPGTWHVAGPDFVSRDELARRIARAFELDSSLIEPVPTLALGQRAARPLRGGLRTEKIARRLGAPLTPLDEALMHFRKQLAT